MSETKDAPFTEMATRILHNQESTFGGAFVVQPPGGDPASTLILTDGDEAQFWMLLQGLITARMEILRQKEAQAASMYGRR